MKRHFVSIGVALLVAMPAYAEVPAWWASLHGAHLTQRELAQVTFPAAPAQVPASANQPVSAVDIPLPPPSGSIKYQPSVIISGGGGFASPSGKFAYYSISKATGVQNTYLTAAQEYTLVKGEIQSCTLAGASKPVYEFGWLDIGLTGLAGGCSSTDGKASVAGSGQVFALLHFGKSPFGMVVTALKNNTGGYKVTLAPSWGK